MGKVINPGDEIHTKIAGVTHKNEEGRSIQRILKDLTGYDPDSLELTLERELNNPYDENAIKVYCEGEHIGYIKAELAKKLADLVDDGVVSGSVSEITGGTEGYPYGCNICLTVAGKTKARTIRRTTVSSSTASTQDNSDWFDADGKLDLWVDAETLSILSLDALERYQEVVRKILDVEVEKRSDLQYTEKLLAQYKLAVAEYTSRANEIRSSKQQKPTFKEGCVQQKWILLVFAILFCACGVLYCTLDRTINFLGLFMTGLGLFSLVCFLIGVFASD